MIRILAIVLIATLAPPQISAAETAPCLRWGTMPGQKGTVCRERAVAPLMSNLRCRLRSEQVDLSTSKRICTYMQAGRGKADVVISVDPGGSCMQAIRC